MDGGVGGFWPRVWIMCMEELFSVLWAHKTVLRLYLSAPHTSIESSLWERFVGWMGEAKEHTSVTQEDIKKRKNNVWNF